MKTDSKLGRREFLRSLGAGAGLVGLAVAAAATVATEAAAAESEQEAKKARYQPNSPDVKNYYRVNRF